LIVLQNFFFEDATQLRRNQKPQLNQETKLDILNCSLSIKFDDELFYALFSGISKLFFGD